MNTTPASPNAARIPCRFNRWRIRRISASAATLIRSAARIAASQPSDGVAGLERKQERDQWLIVYRSTQPANSRNKDQTQRGDRLIGDDVERPKTLLAQL